MSFVDHPGFANSDAEAERRYSLAKQSDPFPEIVHSLLNSADIFDYVRMTGMLYPFHSGKVKSASYEAAIHGRCIWWDGNGERQEKLLREESIDQFVLRANSIAFVQVEPAFRLPDYIALRFNLKIEHVHRGILLGTGPLVDPGFVGQLCIPLHNLTTNDYVFKCGDGLIWIEFTKTSPLPGTNLGHQNASGLTRRGKYVEFPKRKWNLDPEHYLFQASPHKSIRSSIPEVGRKSLEQATKSAKEASKARSFVEWGTIIGVPAFLVALAGATYQTWSLIQDASKAVMDVQQQLRQDTERAQSLVRETEENRKRIQLLEQQLSIEVSKRKSHPGPHSTELGPPGNQPGTPKEGVLKKGSQP